LDKIGGVGYKKGQVQLEVASWWGGAREFVSMAKRQLHISVEDVGGVMVVVLDGAIDASNVKDFQGVVGKLCAGDSPRVLLDCSRLSYVNSTSFGLFFKYHQTCNRNKGTFAMCALWDKIHNIIELLGLEKFINIYPSRKTALSKLGVKRKS
jgi:anti-sigma B factor antagonist